MCFENFLTTKYNFNRFYKNIFYFLNKINGISMVAKN